MAPSVRGIRLKLEPFVMERYQSTWENVVKYNLSESGVHPFTLGEFLRFEPDLNVMGFPLGYCPSQGTPQLRRTIAHIYSGASEENILVTNGSSEANFLCSWNLLDRGEELVIMLPNYMEIWGLAKTFGARIRPFHLREKGDRWVVDEEEVKGAITTKTRLVAICNPNNPTGATYSKDFLGLVTDLAGEVGAWVLSDEVYQGAEREGPTTPSLWSTGYERTMVVNGLSKAYGLPGLRIGWVVAPPEKIQELWGYRDYTSIGTSYPADLLAQVALKPQNRRAILERTRKILNRNYPIIREWVKGRGGTLRFVESEAGAILYLAYILTINSTVLAEKLRTEKDVLIVPGDQFGMDGYIRIGYGPEKDYLVGGLERIGDLLDELGGAG